MTKKQNQPKCLKCNRQPSFNIKGESKALYCKEHKSPIMIDVTHILCAFFKCPTRPSYNFPNQPALYCLKHIKDGMVNVRDNLCAYKNCDVQPIYNYPDQKRGLYCNIHKKDDMIDVMNGLNIAIFICTQIITDINHTIFYVF